MKRTAVAVLACLTLAVATYLVYRAGHDLSGLHAGAHGFFQPRGFVGPRLHVLRPIHVRPLPAHTYTVRRGDCLWTIGQQLHVPWRTLAVANHVHTPYLIYPGQVLTWR